MKRFYLSKLTILTAILTGYCVSAIAQTITYSTPSSTPVTYTIPGGVTAIGVDVQGSQGGNAGSSYGNGGMGGRVQATIAVSTGQVLQIYVGGQGANLTGSCCSTTAAGGVGGATGGASGAYYYGAGGGGSSEIRVGGTAITNRVIVAGGGGGGGSEDCTGATSGGELGGAGGNATGATGQICGSTTWCSCYNATGGSQTAGGYAPCNGAYGSQTSGSNGVYYAGGGGGGYWGGGGGYYYSGGGGGSSYPITAGATLGGVTVSNINLTQGYTTGNGKVILCIPNVGFIFSNSPVCIGSTMTLTATASGGAWSSGNTSIATIDPVAGTVTGVATGNATITYSVNVAGCGSGFVTAVVTVNPAPALIGGVLSACPGTTTSLTDATPSGTWSSSNITLATVGSTSGTVAGITAGTLQITYTLTTTGCTAIAPVTINPLPLAIAGTANVCAGGAITALSDPIPGGSWTSSAPSIATVTGTGLVTGMAAGTVTITYTLPTNCFITRSVLVNPLPGPISGVTTVCAGNNTTLSDAGGGTWSSSNTSLATVSLSSGIVTGVSSGTPNITYTLPTGCTTFIPVLVNALPAPITGIAGMCTGGSTTLFDATAGGTWTSGNPVIASIIPVGGVVSGISAGTAPITYTLGTGCGVTSTVTVYPLPNAYNVTGGGGFCIGGVGVHVGLDFSNSGVNYKLYNGGSLVSTLAGSNSGLDFGLQTVTGTYTVVAVDATTNCTSNMTGSATVSINPMPNIYSVSGGGNYCAGGSGAHIFLSGSDASVNYQLYLGGFASGGPVIGTGTALDLGAHTGAGTYTVVATNPTTGCSANMVGSATIVINASPTVYTLSPGGGYCAGLSGIDIILSGSDILNNYQLYIDGLSTGSPMPGTGSALHFGLHTTAGAYTVVATNAATCSSNMTGSSIITVNPLPNIYLVSGGGSYCAGGAGVHIGLIFSNTGINYQLYRGIAAVGGPVPGTNAGLDLGAQTLVGTYTIIATDATTGCQSTMLSTATVSINPLPNTFTVTGGGSFCSGGTGVHVGLNGSTSGIKYQLMYGGTPSGSPITGTGAALDFGLHNATGIYTVVATNTTTSCTSNMLSSATISINSLPNSYTVTGAGTSYCAGAGGIDLLLSGSDAGTQYQLYRGTTASGIPIIGTGSLLNLGFQTAAGVYTVIATNIAGCSGNMIGSATINVNPRPNAYSVVGGGSYCAGGIGVHVGLSGSNSGINYQLFGVTSGVVGGPVAGTGAAIDFGYETTADVYTVIATDAITNCTNSMTGSVAVAINPLPFVHTLTGGGNYCLGGTGRPIGLDGSDSGIVYQLYHSSATSGSAITGTGSLLNFGLRTGAGTYTVVANNPITTCSNNMSGIATIVINPLPVVHTVTGGGVYCAPGTGLHVNLSTSDTGFTYQLYFMGAGDTTLLGTGTGLDFGLQTGIGGYNVVATDGITGCINNMSGSVTISTLPKPNIDTMIDGGSYCVGGAGRHVELNSSDTGIQYQLYNGTSAIGSLISGTGSAIYFGPFTAAGSYTVIASPGGICQSNMFGTSTITINPLPNAYTITGGGNYCLGDTGMHIGLSGSNGSVKYQLFRGSTAVGGMVTGTGSPLDFGLESVFGTYTSQAIDTVTGCSSNLTASGSVSIGTLPLPVVFNVTGGGNYCAGGTGVHITLSGSNTDINYQLYFAGAALGSPMAGTGTILDFGLKTSAGGYTAVATDAATGCVNRMADTAHVGIDPVLIPGVSIAAHPGLNIVKQQLDTLVATATTAGSNPTYQWLLNGFPITGATNQRFISNKFVNHDSLTCLVTSSGVCGGVTTGHSVVITVGSATIVQQFIASNSNVNVIPNPNKGIFNIVGDLGTNEDEDVSIEVSDLLGHVIYNNKTVARSGSINERIQLSNLANGMYILSLRSGTENKVFHIVIEQ